MSRVHNIQKRHAGGGHGAAPEKLILPPDGKDPWPPQATWLDEFNAVPTETHPAEYQEGLKLKNWYNYHEFDKKTDLKLFPSAEENLRMWQTIHVERMLDNHPTHEIHAKDLPDYHFWPMIQNDKEAKFTGQVPQLVQFQYHTDQHEIPRFHKNGVPKTPPQEQVWYTPLDDNGRCNWRAVMARWAGYDSILSTRGWQDRYLRWAYIDSVAQWRNSLKVLNITKPILYKHRELDFRFKYWRQKRGTKMASPIYFWAFWFWVLSGTGSQLATYSNLCWEDEPWNYDIHYARYFRNNGSFHAPI